MITDGKYILDKNGKPKLEKNLYAWASWMENGNRILKKTTVGKYSVSTVFLGIDYRFSGKGKPVLWETMVFRPLTKREADKMNQEWADTIASLKKRKYAHDKALLAALPKTGLPKYKAGRMVEADTFPMLRYTSKEDALKGHAKTVRLVKKAILKTN